jgi:LemA protein
MSLWLIILIAVVVLAILFGVITYNGMIRSRNMVGEAWSGIDVQLKRRHDLIPNLVDSVQGYAAHEREAFQAVTDARAGAMSASGPAASGAAEGILDQALGRLFAVAEAYPQLRATENFQQLQAELSNTEDQIAAARRIYNGNVQSYNTRMQVFPNSLIAGMGHFTPREFFEIADAADREPVTVDFPAPAAGQTPAG